jgi:hypothetical protein
MDVNEIKARVRDDRYVVDPHQVAAAMLRRAAPRGALTAHGGPVSPRDARGHAAGAVPPRPRS